MIFLKNANLLTDKLTQYILYKYFCGHWHIYHNYGVLVRVQIDFNQPFFGLPLFLSMKNARNGRLFQLKLGYSNHWECKLHRKTRRILSPRTITIFHCSRIRQFLIRHWKKRKHLNYRKNSDYSPIFWILFTQKLHFHSCILHVFSLVMEFNSAILARNNGRKKYISKLAMSTLNNFIWGTMFDVYAVAWCARVNVPSFDKSLEIWLGRIAGQIFVK